MMISSHRLLSALAIALALGGGLSCASDVTQPETRTADDTRFLHVAHGFPPLVASRASFWAVKGKSSGTVLWFHADPGSRDSVKLLDFTVGPGSLDRRADGSVIAAGDSVQISVTVIDPYHLVVEYQPAGLKFASNDQPKLRMYWAACGDDLNYDGKVDAADASLIGQLGIWRQESPTLPWVKQPSSTSAGARVIESPLSGFSGYAIML